MNGYRLVLIRVFVAIHYEHSLFAALKPIEYIENISHNPFTLSYNYHEQVPLLPDLHCSLPSSQG